MIESLPFILTHRGIVYSENGRLYILDRRCYPFEIKYFSSSSYEETAWALASMVTQGGAVLEVALAQLVLSLERVDDIDKVVESLSSARRTNKAMANALARAVGSRDIKRECQLILDEYDARYERLSDEGERLIEDGETILTTCFPEHSFILSIMKAKKNGKRVSVLVPETRPYLQGAHLTEPALREVGIDCALITDGMTAHFAQEGRITKYMTASDAAFRDGSVINKVGTLSNAIICSYYSIPYYAFSVALSDSSAPKDIEVRDGKEVKEIHGMRFASSEAKALYPLFDYIPHTLVSGIITENGVYKAR